MAERARRLGMNRRTGQQTDAAGDEESQLAGHASLDTGERFEGPISPGWVVALVVS